MTDKSWVTIEQKICVVCGTKYDSGCLLLDTRIRFGKLRETFEHKTVTGWGMCPDHEKLREEYVALVECDPTKLNSSANTAEPDEVYRTGRIAHIRRTAWCFNIPIPEKGVCFIEPAVFDFLAVRAG